ncbi:caspase family protein [bacterium]|nr:caspase family protein [bacterium]
MHFNHGYALLIGVGACEYPKWSLPTTVKDAQAIQQVLTDADLCAYAPEQIRLLHNETATRQRILDGLAWLAQSVQKDPEATAVVYFSGHGWLHKETGDYYLVPHDVEPFNFTGSALAAADFTEALRNVKAKRLLAFIDSCHAEGMATAKDEPSSPLPPSLAETALPKAVIDDLALGEGRAVFTSSRGEQRSWLRPDKTLSIFTYHLLEAFQGAHNVPGDAFVKVSNLMNYLGEQVSESAWRLCSADQSPFFKFETEDFPVAVLRGGKGLPKGGWDEVSENAQETIARYSATVTGDGSIAQGGSVAAGKGGIAVKGNVQGGIRLSNRDRGSGWV